MAADLRLVSRGHEMAPSGYRIRPGTADDAEAAAALWDVMAQQHRAYNVGFWGWADDAAGNWRRAWMKHLDSDDMVLLAAAGPQGELAGFAVGHVRDSGPVFATGKVAEVWDLVVAPAHRGRGLGEALVAALCDRLKEKGCENVTLHVALANEAAVGLYGKLGFRPVMYRMYRSL